MSSGLALGAGGGRWKRYPAYRDSGVEWWGEVPEGWEVKRLKHLCSYSALYGANEPATAYVDEGVRFLRTTDITDKGELLPENAVFLEIEQVKDYLLEDGDLLISRSGTIGRSFVHDASKHGQCAYAGYLVRFVLNDELYPRFAFYYTKTDRFSKYLSMSVIQSTIGNVNGQKYANMPLPTPPLPEQHAIAAFLDRETGRIDALIAKKERQIELLQEKRTALISHAVTKGLDPDAPMKDSGVEWLGEVPEHWAKMGIKHLLHQIIDTEHKTAPYSPDGKYLVVRTANVRNGILSFDDAKYTDSEGFKEWTRRGVPKPGDILFTREAPAGEACIVPDNVPLCIGQRMVLFRVNKQRLDARFGIYSIYGGLADEFIRSLSQGSTVEHFNMSDIGNTPLFKPSLSEQHTIAAFLDHETGHIDVLTTKVYESISKLYEYRTALISAAVTGKIDVRGEKT